MELLSEKIANCPKCFKQAEYYDKDNAGDLFQTVWLKIREKELKGRDFSDVQYYFTFFSFVLRNTFYDQKKKKKLKTVNLSDIDKRLPLIEIEQEDYGRPCPADLNEYMYEDVDNEEQQFCRNLLILQLKVPRHKSAANIALMSRRHYLKLRKESNEIAKNEISNRIGINDNSFDSRLV